MPSKNTIKKSALAPTVLIAGGAGFIGSHLVAKLLENKARVIVLDNFKTGKKIYIEGFLKNPNFALFESDVNQQIPEQIESVDYIVHLAGLEEYLFNKNYVNLETLLTNGLGTKNLLDLAKKSEAKFLLISSVDIYQGTAPLHKIDNYFGKTEQEENKYSLIEAKRYAEALVWEFFKTNNIDSRIVRLPEVYGPRMDLTSCGELGRILDDFLHQKDLTIYGEGTEKSYYLYIDDAINGIFKALFGKGTKGQIFTLANNEPYSALEIAYFLKSIADKTTEVIFKSSISNNYTKEIKLPESVNLSQLEWSAKVNFKQGVKHTVEWFGYKINELAFKPNRILSQPINLVEQPPKDLFTQPITPMAVAFNHSETPQPQAVQQANVTTPYINNNKYAQPVDKTSFLKKITNWWLGINKNTAIILALSIALITIFLLLPLGQAYFYLTKAKENFLQIEQSFNNVSLKDAKDQSNQAFVNLIKGQSAFVKLKWAFSITNKAQLFKQANTGLDSAVYFSKGIYFFAKATSPLANVWQGIKPNSDKVFNEEEFIQTKTDFINAEQNIQLANAAFKAIDPNVLPEKVTKYFEKYTNTINTIQTNLTFLTEITQNIPDLLGLKEKKRYLILLQNNNELRPTGGFIGSYAILELEKGKITKLMIDDIYNPDGQIGLRGIIFEAPEPVKQFLKEEKLHIRNANWNPDFTKSAQDIIEMFNKVEKAQIDGVISLDLFFAQNLLKVTGPLFLTAYNEEINEGNLYERTQLHSEFNYKEGSDQKKSFLTVMGSKLIESIFALPNEKVTDLFTQIEKSLNERHLQIYLPNNQLSKLLKEKNWDGSLIDTSSDYLNIINSNLGGTKANYFVKQNYKYKVTSATRDGLLRAQLELNYQHTGQDSNWPGGPYTNYLRVLTQKNAKLTGAKIKGTNAKNEPEEKDIFKDIKITDIQGYNAFETSFKLEPTKEVTLVIEYDITPSLSLNKQNPEYNLYIQKQAGTGNDNYEVNIDIPFGMVLENKTNGSNQENDKIIYKVNLNSDKQFYIKLK